MQEVKVAALVGLRDVRYEAGENHYAKTAGTLAQGDMRARAPEGEANPLYIPKDDSNPYFTYDPSKCIVCSRCVRACEEVQGTFALTIAGRGFRRARRSTIFCLPTASPVAPACRPARPRRCRRSR